MTSRARSAFCHSCDDFMNAEIPAMLIDDATRSGSA
jgi:hypothetical protein